MAENAPADTRQTTLDTAALNAWIGDQLPGAGEPLTAERMGADTGIANALFIVSRGGSKWVLRQPPLVKNHPSASNTEREWKILKALDGTDVPHPEALLFCSDTNVLGQPFMIMGLIDGFTPGFSLPEPFLSDKKLRHGLGMAYVDGCASLANIADWKERGLGDLGKPEGFLHRQVSRWLGQLDGYRTREIPELDFLTKWLENNRPEMSRAGILHGDYSPFNVMVANDPPARLAAVVDWDTGTIGDPLLDIGHLLARWAEPGEVPLINPQAGGLDGYPTRREMAAHYAERTGRDMSAIAYYEVLALFKLAVILEGSYARQHAAGVPDSQNQMFQVVIDLMKGAAEFARGERV